MTQANEKFAMYRPRCGQEIKYAGKVTGRVHRVEGNLCWNDYHGQREPLPFIWCFRDGLNALHDWPSKAGGPEAPCPGKNR